MGDMIIGIAFIFLQLFFKSHIHSQNTSLRNTATLSFHFSSKEYDISKTSFHINTWISKILANEPSRPFKQEAEIGEL
jgi:hypothetical protein